MYELNEFTYSGIKQDNRNPLLITFDGADGFKTGIQKQLDMELLVLLKEGVEDYYRLEWFRNFKIKSSRVSKIDGLGLQ